MITLTWTTTHEVELSEEEFEELVADTRLYAEQEIRIEEKCAGHAMSTTSRYKLVQNEVEKTVDGFFECIMDRTDIDSTTHNDYARAVLRDALMTKVM